MILINLGLELEFDLEFLFSEEKNFFFEININGLKK
jgi:hypothetical protein